MCYVLLNCNFVRYTISLMFVDFCSPGNVNPFFNSLHDFFFKDGLLFELKTWIALSWYFKILYILKRVPLYDWLVLADFDFCFKFLILLSTLLCVPWRLFHIKRSIIPIEMLLHTVGIIWQNKDNSMTNKHYKV